MIGPRIVFRNQRLFYIFVGLYLHGVSSWHNHRLHKFGQKQKENFPTIKIEDLGIKRQVSNRNLHRKYSLQCIATQVSFANEQSVIDNERKTQNDIQTTIKNAYNAYGLPWHTSIDPTYGNGSPFYKPFWDWQIQFMTGTLTNLHMLQSTNRLGTSDLTYAENLSKKKRMVTFCFASDEYRLIRMTLLDAGNATQVFTSLWCPRANLPVLGIDLLQFNAKRHLTVVDFQPIHPTEAGHDATYEYLLRPIRASYPTLQYKMSDRFYDENQFFSSEMLLGRQNTTDYIWDELMPAYKAYTKIHVNLTKEYTVLKDDKVSMEAILKYQKAYDDYSSVRDPAHGLLAAIFGQEYADDFVYDVLFPLSDRPVT